LARTKKLSCLFFGVSLLTGCATTAVHPHQAIKRLMPIEKYREFSPSKNAKLIVVRDSGLFGSACIVEVLLDGEKIGDLQQREKFEFHLEPKKYVLSGRLGGAACGGNLTGDAEVSLMNEQTVIYRMQLKEPMFLKVSP